MGYQDFPYHPWNEEAGEEVPEAKEERHDNCCYLVIWCKGHKHHSIECEVDEAHEHVVVEPEELCSLPLESNHRVKDKAVKESLDPNVDCFHSHLSRSNLLT